MTSLALREDCIATSFVLERLGVSGKGDMKCFPEEYIPFDSPHIDQRDRPDNHPLTDSPCRIRSLNARFRSISPYALCCEGVSRRGRSMRNTLYFSQDKHG
jgi:hypothetical protein